MRIGNRFTLAGDAIGRYFAIREYGRQGVGNIGGFVAFRPATVCLTRSEGTAEYYFISLWINDNGFSDVAQAERLTHQLSVIHQDSEFDVTVVSFLTEHRFVGERGRVDEQKFYRLVSVIFGQIFEVRNRTAGLPAVYRIGQQDNGLHVAVSAQLKESAVCINQREIAYTIGGKCWGAGHYCKCKQYR